MKTITVLKRAKKLIETKGWTQGEFARSESWAPVYPTSTRAVCYCALGAILCVLKEPRRRKRWSEAYVNAAAALRPALPTAQRNIDHYNDAPRRTKAQVLGLFDRAIAKLEKANA